MGSGNKDKGLISSWYVYRSYSAIKLYSLTCHNSHQFSGATECSLYDFYSSERRTNPWDKYPQLAEESQL